MAEGAGGKPALHAGPGGEGHSGGAKSIVRSEGKAVRVIDKRKI